MTAGARHGAKALVLGVLVFLTACAAAPPPIQDTSTVKPDAGFVALRLNTDWTHNGGSLFASLEFFYFTWDRSAPGDPEKAHQRSITMKSTSDFVMLELPAGAYHWNYIGFGDYYLPLSMQGGFDVEAGKITYVGDITHNLSIHGFSVSNDLLSVVDNDAQAQEQIQRLYPGIHSTHQYRKLLTQVTAWQNKSYQSRARPRGRLFECREPYTGTESGICPF